MRAITHQSDLRQEINKRLTLNWLIQGASEHAGLTMHYLVRDELLALHPRLVRLYDQFALVGTLQYWHLEGMLIFGRPGSFWRRATRRKRHPFHAHPLLSRYGGMLAEATRGRASGRCREKGVARLPVAFSLQCVWLTAYLLIVEMSHRTALEGLARKAASMAMGIPMDRLRADLTAKQNVPFGDLRSPRSLRGMLLRAAVIGYGGVAREGDGLVVMAKATNWLVLAKELVKGTAELICLHGLNGLSDAVYEQVMDATDRIEYEPWMLQSGGELWRRLLGALPEGLSAAQALMRMARLPPEALERLVEAVIQEPEWARELLGGLEG